MCLKHTVRMYCIVELNYIVFFRNHSLKISHVFYKIKTSVTLVHILILQAVIVIKQKEESLYKEPKSSKVTQKRHYAE